MEDQGDEVKLESPEQQDSLQMEQEMEQNGAELQNIVDGKPYKRVLPDYGNVNDSSEQSRGQEGESSGFAVQMDDQNEDWPVQQNQEETVGRDADMEQKQQAVSLVFLTFPIFILLHFFIMFQLVCIINLIWAHCPT